MFVRHVRSNLPFCFVSAAGLLTTGPHLPPRHASVVLCDPEVMATCEPCSSTNFRFLTSMSLAHTEGTCEVSGVEISFRSFPTTLLGESALCVQHCAPALHSNPVHTGPLRKSLFTPAHVSSGTPSLESSASVIVCSLHHLVRGAGVQHGGWTIAHFTPRPHPSVPRINS